MTFFPAAPPLRIEAQRTISVGRLDAPSPMRHAKTDRRYEPTQADAATVYLRFPRNPKHRSDDLKINKALANYLNNPNLGEGGVSREHRYFADRTISFQMGMQNPDDRDKPQARVGMVDFVIVARGKTEVAVYASATLTSPARRLCIARTRETLVAKLHGIYQARIVGDY